MIEEEGGSLERVREDWYGSGGQRRVVLPPP